MKQLFKKTLVALVCATFIFACKKKKDATPEEVCKVTTLRFSSDARGRSRFESTQSAEGILGKLTKKNSVFQMAYDFEYDADDRLTAYTVYGIYTQEQRFVVNYNDSGELASLASKSQGEKYELNSTITFTESDTLITVLLEQEYERSRNGEIQKLSDVYETALSIDDKDRIKAVYYVYERDGKKLSDLLYSVEYDENDNVTKILGNGGRVLFAFENYDLDKKNIIAMSKVLSRVVLVGDLFFEEEQAMFMLSKNAYGTIKVGEDSFPFEYEVNDKGFITHSASVKPFYAPIFDVKTSCD